MVSRLGSWIRAGLTGLRERRQRGAFDPVSIIAGITIIGLMSGAAYAYWPAMYAQGNTSSCEQNLDGISQAAEMYMSTGKHTLPATGAVSATMFVSNGTNLLEKVPIDPADPTGAATYTFTNTSANGVMSYVIQCPGTHTAMSLQGLPGWKSTSSSIYRSGGQDYTQ